MSSVTYQLLHTKSTNLRESGVSMSFQLVEWLNFDGNFWRRESTVPNPEFILAPHSAQPQV